MENEETMLLTSIPGIGFFSALLIYAEIGDIKRFPNSKKLCSYAGLVPSIRQSGNKTITGKITKERKQTSTGGFLCNVLSLQ